MNHKTLHTWKPRLTADEESVVAQGLRMLLLNYQRQQKVELDWATRAGLREQIDKVLAAAKSLELDVAMIEDEGGVL